MAQEVEKWEPFAHVVDDDDDDDDDEALSLSDLPDNLSDNNNNSSSSKPTCNPHTADTPATEFEFRVSFGGETATAAATAAAAADAFAADMCAADEVFFRGQLLPLRPSLSSSSSSSCCSSSESSALLFRSGSLSDSLDRSASSTGLSSRSSSGCVSRSPSSNGGADPAAARLPAAPANYLLFALPSPSPQIRRKCGAGGAPPRRSTSSHGPAGLFRLGVARAPDLVELRDLRMRSRSHADAAAARDGRKSLSISSNGNSSINNSSNNGGGRGCEQKAAGRRSTRAASFVGRGFGCSCAPDAVEPVSSPLAAASSRKKAAAAAAASASPPVKEKEEEEEEERRGTLKRGESMCRRRILEWMEELSIGKVVVR